MISLIKLTYLYNLIKKAKFEQAIHYAILNKLSSKYEFMKQLKLAEAYFFDRKFKESITIFKQEITSVENSSFLNSDERKYLLNFIRYFTLKISGNKNFQIQDEIDLKNIRKFIILFFWHQTQY
jgi:hypothetical protein